MAINIPTKFRQLFLELFPDLKEGVSFEFTSEVDYNYNCLAWALSINHHNLENSRGAFWPWKDIPDDTADGWVKICEIHGFSLIGDTQTYFVPGFEKIAIFQQDAEDEDGNLHAARQDRNGKWKSKLGTGPDIDHIELAPFERVYGKIARVLQKYRPDWIEQDQAKV